MKRSSRTHRSRRTPRLPGMPGRVALVAVGTLVASCSGHHLDEYDFTDRTLAVVHFDAPAPELRTGPVGVGGDNPVEVVVEASGRVVREVEARRARARLDSAWTRVDLGRRMADRTLERASRYLGTRPVEEAAGADYLMEVDIRRLGLDAGRGTAYLYFSGEAVLLDGRTGREIWDADVGAHERLTPSLLIGSPDALEDLFTAGALSGVSVDEFEQILGGLADLVADRIGRELRGDLRRVRDE